MARRGDTKDLRGMSHEKLCSILDAISEDQAEDSDIGGDSDAEDYSIILESVSSLNDSIRRASASEEGTPGGSHSPASHLEADVEIHDIQPGSLCENMRDSDSSEVELEIPNAVDQINVKFNKKTCKPNSYQQMTFTQPFGPNVPIHLASPFSIFSLFLTVTFMQYIVDQSNLYASQKGVDLKITVEELQATLGILIIMGFHSLPSYKLYWSSDPNFHVPRIANIMSLKRFLKIIRFLHLNDNSIMPRRGETSFDKVYKLRPLLTELNCNFRNSFNPGRHLSVDESMVGFKGRSSLKQYLPMKPIKRGFKIWTIACAISGFMLNFEIYEGKKDGQLEGTLGERTVLELARSFQIMGYCLFFDRFFSSIPLFKKLLDRGLFGGGKILQTRKYFPKTILKADRELQMGQSDYASSGEISITKWKDRGAKSVAIISNMHDSDDHTTVQRKNKKGEKETVSCPRCVSDYNKYMGGVDRFDQMLETYSISWKSRKWWMKTFYYLIDACIVNSYILHRETTKLKNNKEKPISHLTFRSTLANELIGSFRSRKTRGPDGRNASVNKSKFKKHTGCPQNTLKLVDVGLLLPVKGTMRRCAYCSTKAKPKRSSTICKACNVALCRDCFAPLHSKN